MALKDLAGCILDLAKAAKDNLLLLGPGDGLYIEDNAPFEEDQVR